MFIDAAPPVSTDPFAAPIAPGADASLRDLDAETLERRIGELAGQIAAATCRWLLLVAEFDRRGEHERQGFSCCARWLAWRCSVSRRTAFEYVRVARALADLPLTTASFAAGKLSYSKVRALTRVVDPDDEQALLDLAEDATAAQLERILLAYRKATSPDEAEEARARRHLTTSWEDDGNLRISGILPAEEGTLLLKALEIACEGLWRERTADRLAEATPADDEGERKVAEDCPAPSTADAIVALADDFLARGSLGADRSGGDRHQVICHVDLADLADPGSARSNAVVEGRAGLPPATASRIACDASVMLMVESGGSPVSVGRKTRAIPPAIARALRSRDHGCRFPGCGSTRFVDAHHVRHWAAGGETSLDNLVRLCRHHHRLVHEGGFGVEMVAGRPRFTTPDGERIPDAPKLGPSKRGSGPAPALLRWVRGIDQRTVMAGSRGEPFDLDLTVSTLACRRE